MKTLENKIIVYDDVCPVCEWYTAKFVETGILKAENRLGFGELTDAQRQQIDPWRGRHEIPMLDTETQQTIYGIDAMFLLFAQKWPMLRLFFQSDVLKSVARILYKFVSHNRRVIANSPTTNATAPDYHLGHRMALVGIVTGLAVIIHGLETYWLATIWKAHSVAYGTLGLFIMTLIWLFLAYSAPFRSQKYGDYAGHVAISLLIATVLFLPLNVLLMIVIAEVGRELGFLNGLIFVSFGFFNRFHYRILRRRLVVAGLEKKAWQNAQWPLNIQLIIGIWPLIVIGLFIGLALVQVLWQRL